MNTILKRLKEFGIESREMHFLFKNEVQYLGKIVNLEGFRDDHLNIVENEKLKEATENVGNLQKLFGFIG